MPFLAEALSKRYFVSASARNGIITHSKAVTPSGSCAQEYTMLTDVATARDFAKGESQRMIAAYAGDTWGNLWRYQLDSSVGDNASPDGSVELVENTGGEGGLTTGCKHPLYYAPAVVQMDRDVPTLRAKEIYLVQVTNSALDPDTIGFPEASKIILRKDIVAGGRVTTDTTFGSGGRIEMDAADQTMICGDLANDKSCNGSLPRNGSGNVISRPSGTPIVFLKEDGSGFQVMTLWYAQSLDGCRQGTSHLTIHEVKTTGEITQVYGKKVASPSEDPVGAITVTWPFR
jgi:hypothetical protein